MQVRFTPGRYARYRAEDGHVVLAAAAHVLHVGRLEERVDPGVLARQLEAVAALAWTSYRRRYLEVVTSWRDQDEQSEPSDQDREFEQWLAQLIVEGRSAQGWVVARSRALVAWEVSITGEPVGSLAEREFLAEFDDAVTALLVSYRRDLTLLTDAIYAVGLPRAMRSPGEGES